MSCEMEGSNCSCRSKGSNATWIALAGIGVTAAVAFYVYRRVQAKGGNVASLFDVCERAAQTLDDRLGVKEALYAVG